VPGAGLKFVPSDFRRSANLIPGARPQSQIFDRLPYLNLTAMFLPPIAFARTVQQIYRRDAARESAGKWQYRSDRDNGARDHRSHAVRKFVHAAVHHRSASDINNTGRDEFPLASIVCAVAGGFKFLPIRAILPF
jgi:hypothetical protein